MSDSRSSENTRPAAWDVDEEVLAKVIKVSFNRMKLVKK